MTSRLKRKLGDLGVDTDSRRANENFCLIGTPLPPLEKSKDTGEFVPLWKQEVTDEKGRRRLHGAFTGGFSAGYFNTVGSAEGWTPSTFVSSRGERARSKNARPEDFMDDEDLQELRDNKNMIDTTEQMDFMGGTQADLQRQGKLGDEAEKDSISSALESAMLPAPKDSAGAAILKKMGWKVGQGIGPRVSLRQRRLQDLRATTGRVVSIKDVHLDEQDAEADKHTYAPRDTPVLIMARKDNAHGLGYSPGMGLDESLGRQAGSSASGPQISAGFGLGALNDADDDDVDIYENSFSKSRSRTAYDIEQGGEDDHVSIGQKNLKRKVAEQRSAPVYNTRDTRPVLQGFILSDKPVAEDRWFPLPEVPKGWTPDPRRVWDKQGDKENQTEQLGPPSGPIPHDKWKSNISADQRGSLLGETPLPSAPRSVFDFISAKDQERIKNAGIAGSDTRHPLPSSSPSIGPTPAPASLSIPHLEPHIAGAALRGFQPFAATDKSKHARYNAYLESQADPSIGVPSFVKGVDMQDSKTVEDLNRELSEYAKSAQIFKPMSGAMAGRFTSAVVIDHGPKVVEGLHAPTEEEIKQAEEKKKQAEKEREENISPKEHAAKMGMYGPMTRETKAWQPAKLLCKRFGVKDPDPMPDSAFDFDAEGQAKPAERGTSAEDAASSGKQETHEELLERATQSFNAPQTQHAPTNKKDISNVGLGEDDSQGKDILTYTRPKMDVFKAIFASDDEDSDDEKDEQKHKDIDAEEPDASEPPPPAPSEPASKGKTSGPVPSPASNEPVDISTFRPTFVKRENRATAAASSSDEKEKKKKKKKDKGKTKLLTSFAADEEEEDMFTPARPPPPAAAAAAATSSTKESKHDGEARPKKRKRKDKDKDDEEELWVEKPSLPTTGLGQQDGAAEQPVAMEVDESPANTAGANGVRARKRAADFL